MTLSKLLTSAGAALLLAVGLAGPANAVVIVDTGLGFGKFLGTWRNDEPFNDDVASTMPNPTENPDNVEEVGMAILFRYPSSFPITEFNLAGAADDYGTALDNSNPANTGFRVNSDTNGTYARWDYYGFPPGPAVPDVTPGMEPTELYVAVKYGDYTSVFLYSVVNPGQFGYVTSDFQIILDNTAPGDYVALNYNGLTGTEQVLIDPPGPDTEELITQGCSVTDFSPICMPYNPPRQERARHFPCCRLLAAASDHHRDSP